MVSRIESGRRSRRPFVWPLLALVALAAAGTLGAQPGRTQEGARPGSPGPRVYEGVSRRGDFQEALNDAVERALRALPGADRMVRYRVREITGERGGFAGVNVLRVTIEVAAEGGAPRPDPPGGNERDRPFAGLEVTLKLSPARVKRDGEVTLTLTAVNRSNAAVVLPFATSQKYDFEVRRGEQVMWQWSHDRAFAQVLTQTRIPPGEAVTFREKWNLRSNAGEPVPAGEYRARGILTVQGTKDRPAATAPLVVTD
jgi:hypothetical protein